MSESTVYITIAKGYTQVPRQKWYILFRRNDVHSIFWADYLTS